MWWLGLFTRRPCPSLSRVARGGGQLGFKLSFSSQTAKSECFGLLFKSEKVSKVSSAYARCQKWRQGHKKKCYGLLNGVRVVSVFWVGVRPVSFFFCSILLLTSFTRCIYLLVFFCWCHWNFCARLSFVCPGSAICAKPRPQPRSCLAWVLSKE